MHEYNMMIMTMISLSSQLNRWAFKRSRTATCFTVSHPLFRRGDFRLCQMMSCSKADDISFPGPPVGNNDAADHAALLGCHEDPSMAPIMPQLFASSQFGSSSRGGYPSEQALLDERRGLGDSLVGSASSFLQQQQQQRAEAAALMAGGSQKSLLSVDIATGRRRAGMMAPEDNLPYSSFRSNRELLLDNMGDYYGPLVAARSDGRALGSYPPLEVSSSGIRRGLVNNQHLAQHDPTMLSLSNARHRMIGDFMLNSALASAGEEAATLTRMGAQLEGAPLGGVGDGTTHKDYLREVAPLGSRNSSGGMVDFASAGDTSSMLKHHHQKQLYGGGSSSSPFKDEAVTSFSSTRKFHPSMEAGQRAALARQEDLCRSSTAAAYHATNFTNNHSGESVLLAAARRQQQWQGTRGNVAPSRRNADRIINDAFNVLQYSS